MLSDIKLSSFSINVSISLLTQDHIFIEFYNEINTPINLPLSSLPKPRKSASFVYIKEVAKKEKS